MYKQQPLMIRNRPMIGDGLEPYVIAEIGTNHNRDLETAKELLRGVALSGCQCAKFQIYEPSEIVSAFVRAADYGLDELYGDISAQEMFDTYLKTPKEWFPELRDLCHELGMDFSVTIHGPNGLAWAKEMKVDLVKIASMDHTNIPFIKSLVNELDVPVLASLGMAGLADVALLSETLQDHEPGYGLFHCCAIYPPSPDELRLSNIPFLIDNFPAHIGFSDHTTEADAAKLARSMGAVMFEKHVTLDRRQSGPDHPFAMEIDPFKDYVLSLSQRASLPPNTADSKVFVEPSPREMKNRAQYVKSIVAKAPLPSGHVLTADDFYFARPGTGIAPVFSERLIGKELARDIAQDTLIQWSDLVGMNA